MSGRMILERECLSSQVLGSQTCKTVDPLALLVLVLVLTGRSLSAHWHNLKHARTLAHTSDAVEKVTLSFKNVYHGSHRAR